MRHEGSKEYQDVYAYNQMETSAGYSNYNNMSVTVIKIDEVCQTRNLGNRVRILHLKEGNVLILPLLLDVHLIKRSVK